MKRIIVNVFLVPNDAKEAASYWRGSRPRIYERQARAENLSVSIYVLVIDAEDARRQDAQG